MIDGKFVYYTVESRSVKPNVAPAEGVNYGDWLLCNWDVFGEFLEPWHGKSRPIFMESYEETFHVHRKTGARGWWSLKFAMEAFKRLQKAGQLGGWQSFEFRLVKSRVSQTTEVIDLENPD